MKAYKAFLCILLALCLACPAALAVSGSAVPVSGTAAAGQKLSVDLSPYPGAVCQWQYCTRNSANPADWADLMKADASTYTVPNLLAGRYIRVKVSVGGNVLYSTPLLVEGNTSTLSLQKELTLQATGSPVELPEDIVLSRSGSSGTVSYKYAPYGTEDYVDGLPTEPGEYALVGVLAADRQYAAAISNVVKLTVTEPPQTEDPPQEELPPEPIALEKVTIAGLSAPPLLERLDTYVYSKTGGCRVEGDMTNVTWSPADDTANYDTTYTASVTLVPAEGYVFSDTVSVTVDGIQTMQYTPVNGKISVSVEFHKTAPEPITLETVLVAVSANEGGLIDGEATAHANYSVVQGGDLTITLTPAEGYQLDSVHVDGERVEIESQLELTNLQKDMQVEVKFVKEGTDSSILLWSIVALLAVAAFSTAAVVLRRKGII